MPFHAGTVHIKSKAKKETPKPQPRPKRGKRASLADEKRMKQPTKRGTTKPSTALRKGGGLGRISDALK